MAAELLDLAELRDHLKLKETDEEPVLQPLLDLVEELLEKQTGQLFTAAATVTDEPHNGSGLSTLDLDRPPDDTDALGAAVKVGQDPDDADSTIAITDLIVDVEHWRLIYKNGYRFPDGIRNIFVTYDAADHLPDIAKGAVKEGVAYLFRLRGREHVTGETIGELGSASFYTTALNRLPLWRHAVAILRRRDFY